MTPQRESDYISCGPGIFLHLCSTALWFRTATNPDKSTGPLARPITHLLAPLTRSLAPHCSLCWRASLRAFVHSLDHSLTSELMGQLMIRCLKIRQFRTTVKWLLYRMPTLLLPPGRAGLSGWLFVAASRSPPLRRSSEPSDSFGGAAAYRGIGRQRNIRR